MMVCFLCGHPGHGVNRCSRVDISFPFLPPGWSVAVQDGQYRAVWPGGPMARFQSGNEGWSGREGHPPGPAVTVGLLTTAGGACCPGDKELTGMGVTGGVCAWLRLVSKRVGFSTIGESSAGVFPRGNGVTGRRMFWPSRSRDRLIGLFETLRLRWAGVCRRCSPQCPEPGGLGGGCGLPGGIWCMVSGGKTSAVEKLDSF